MTSFLPSNHIEQLSSMIRDKGLEAVLFGLGEITKKIRLEKEGKTKTMEKEQKLLIEPTNIDNIKRIVNMKGLNHNIKEWINGPTSRMYQEFGYNLAIDPRYAEFIIAKNTDGKLISSGNTPMDVQKGTIGIDVATVCLQGNQTNEKSLLQKFKTEKKEQELDAYFEKKDDKNALKKYLNNLRQKIECSKELGINEHYYFIFISTKKEIYLSVFIIDSKNIQNAYSDGFTRQGKSILISNLINKKFGNTKLYKSKKRIEFRLYKSILNHHNTIKLFG
jgi:hypothetical protein